MSAIEKAVNCIKEYYNEVYQRELRDKIFEEATRDSHHREEFAQFIFDLSNEFDVEPVFISMFHIYIGMCLTLEISKDDARSAFLSAYDEIKKDKANEY